MSDVGFPFQTIKGLAESIQLLNQQAVREYTPVVENILRTRSHDTNHIDHTLDGLLSFCSYEPVLVLFKQLCRHYWVLDPVATASYINAYREMWDSKEAEENECGPATSERGGA
jgi:hypothetical protein